MKHRMQRALTWSAVTLALAGTAYALTGRDPVRATPAERTRPLPGDQFISAPLMSLTHAVTVPGSSEDVWPWLVQMGAGRAGWYSYDFIDNGGRPSAVRLLPQFQAVAVGDILPALPGATEGFIVVAYEPERFLVLAWPEGPGTYMTTWTFVLDDAPGRATRLIVRGRASAGYHFHGLPRWLVRLFGPLGHYAMERRQLLQIARRAGRAQT
jgi:hypothetical protein